MQLTKTDMGVDPRSAPAVCGRSGAGRRSPAHPPRTSRVGVPCLLGVLIAVLSAFPLTSAARDTLPTMQVVEGQGCECCVKWTEYLKEHGFDVRAEKRFGTLLMQHKMELGVPIEHASCHTGEIGGYFIEGHVPVEDIRRLLAEQPEAAGIAVPGMPYGSPGMGPESRREAYDVLLILKDGSSEIFSSYAAANDS